LPIWRGVGQSQAKAPARLAGIVARSSRAQAAKPILERDSMAKQNAHPADGPDRDQLPELRVAAGDQDGEERLRRP
jgi:hypothetical protein